MRQQQQKLGEQRQQPSLARAEMAARTAKPTPGEQPGARMQPAMKPKQEVSAGAQGAAGHHEQRSRLHSATGHVWASQNIVILTLTW